MDIELQAKLYQTYPHFFRRPRRLGSTAPNVGPLDRWGIECGNGWHKLINELAGQYESHIQNLIAQGVHKRYWPRALQVKEKMGTLCVYTSNSRRSPESLIEAIHKAQTASATICESCGHAGALHTSSGYWCILCDSCLAAPEQANDFDVATYLSQLRNLLKARNF